MFLMEKIDNFSEKNLIKTSEIESFLKITEQYIT